jgi:predicted nuclease with TOPRIM domain
MPDNMYDTFADFSGVNAEQNQEADDSYSLVDENRSRKIAEEALRRENTTRVNQEKRDESKQYLEKINRIEQEKAQMKAQYDQEFSALKQQMAQIQGGYGSLKGDIDSHTERMIKDDVLKDELEIMSDPIYGDKYNRDEVRKILLDNAKQGRFLQPKEAFAMANFDRVAKELAELKGVQENRKRFLDSPLSGIGLKKAQSDNRLANVRDINDAKNAAYEIAREKLGY